MIFDSVAVVTALAAPRALPLLPRLKDQIYHVTLSSQPTRDTNNLDTSPIPQAHLRTFLEHNKREHHTRTVSQNHAEILDEFSPFMNTLQYHTPQISLFETPSLV